MTPEKTCDEWECQCAASLKWVLCLSLTRWFLWVPECKNQARYFNDIPWSVFFGDISPKKTCDKFECWCTPSRKWGPCFPLARWFLWVPEYKNRAKLTAIWVIWWWLSKKTCLHYRYMMILRVQLSYHKICSVVSRNSQRFSRGMSIRYTYVGTIPSEVSKSIAIWTCCSEDLVTPYFIWYMHSYWVESRLIYYNLQVAGPKMRKKTWESRLAAAQMQMQILLWSACRPYSCIKLYIDQQVLCRHPAKSSSPFCVNMTLLLNWKKTYKILSCLDLFPPFTLSMFQELLHPRFGQCHHVRQLLCMYYPVRMPQTGLVGHYSYLCFTTDHYWTEF